MSNTFYIQPKYTLLAKVNGEVHDFIRLEIKNLTHLYSYIAGE